MDNLRKIFPIFLFGLLILPFVLLGTFSQPTLDDFSYAGLSITEGFIKFQIDWYMGWSGRYSSTLIMTSLSRILGFSLLGPVSSIITIGLLLCGGYYFLANLTNSKYDKKVYMLWTITFVASILTIIPDLSGSLYWPAGNINYLLGVALYIFFIVNLIKIYKFGRKINLIWSILLAILIIGSSEFMLLNVSITIYSLCLTTLIRNNKAYIELTKLFLISLPFALAAILAPGNIGRMNYAQINVQIDNASFVYEGVLDGINLIGYLLTHPVLILLFILTALITLKFVDTSGVRSGVKVDNKLIGIIFLTMLFSNVFLLKFTLGYTIFVSRYASILIVIYTLAINYLLITQILFSKWLQQRTVFLRNNVNTFLVLNLILLFISIIGQENMSKAIQDIASGEAYKYSTQVNSMYKKLEECSKTGVKECYIVAPSFCPRSYKCIGNYDESGLEDYYSIDKVFLIKE